MSINIQLQRSSGTFRLNAALHLEPGILAIIGPSGSGKTSLLRAIAGLDGAQGQIKNADADLNALPTHKRGIGYLGQRAALLPHLSALGNLQFAQRRGPHPYSEVQQQHLLDELDLRTLLSRRPEQLSGGEQQRLALACALIGGANLLLLDEPTTSLDHQAQEYFLAYLPKLRQHHADLKIVLVTHQLSVAARVADQIATMNAGRLGEVMSANLALSAAPLALRYDASSCLDLVVERYDGEDCLASLRCGEDLLHIPSAYAQSGSLRRLIIPADSVSLSRISRRDAEISTLNQLAVQLIEVLEASPGQLSLCLQTARGNLLARITKKSWHSMGLQVHDRLYAHIKATALH